MELFGPFRVRASNGEVDVLRPIGTTFCHASDTAPSDEMSSCSPRRGRSLENDVRPGGGTVKPKSFSAIESSFAAHFVDSRRGLDKLLIRAWWSTQPLSQGPSSQYDAQGSGPARRGRFVWRDRS